MTKTKKKLIWKKCFSFQKYQKSVPSNDIDRRYFFKNVPLLVPTVLFWQSIGTDIVVTFKVPSAQLCIWCISTVSQ